MLCPELCYLPSSELTHGIALVTWVSTVGDGKVHSERMERIVVATPLGWKQVRKRPQQLEVPRARRSVPQAGSRHKDSWQAATQHNTTHCTALLSVASFFLLPTLLPQQLEQHSHPSQSTYPNAGTLDPSSFPAPVHSTQMEKKHRAGFGYVLG